MKKGLTIVIVMTLLLVGLPWVIGNVVEDRVNRGLDKLVEEAPYLGIVERRYTKGWFRSEQEITFEVLGPMTSALNPATVLVEAVKDATPGVESEPDAPPPATPARFSMRNEILHGPVLGFSGLGLARVNWKFMLEEDVREKLRAFFGTDEPMQVSTRIDFFGGGSTSIDMPGRVLKRNDGVVEISWDDLELVIEHPGDLERFSVYGRWDRFEAKDNTKKHNFAMREMKLDGGGERIIGKLYGSDLDFRIGELSFVDENGAVTSAKDLRYAVESKEDGEFVSFSGRLGSGAIESRELAQKGLVLKSAHYDFTVRRLHTVTLEKFMAAIDASYLDAAAAAEPATDAGFALLKYDPEFVVDRISFETPDGEATLKGVLKLKGVTEKDLKMGLVSLLPRLDADLTFDSPRKLIEGIEGGAEALALAVEGGYARFEGDRARSRIEFRDGELMVNGKVQAIPGLGAPPPPAE